MEHCVWNSSRWQEAANVWQQVTLKKKKSSVIDGPVFGSFVFYKFNVINVIRGTITSSEFSMIYERRERGYQVWHQSWIAGINCMQEEKHVRQGCTLGLTLKADVTRSQKHRRQWPCKNCYALLNVKVFANANQTDFIIYSTGRFRHLITQFTTTPLIELLKWVRQELIAQKNPPQKYEI